MIDIFSNCSKKSRVNARCMIWTYSGCDGVSSSDAKTIFSSIVHNRFPIIFCFKRPPFIGYPKVIISCTTFDISPHDFHIFITIWTILLMIKPNCMDKFVNYCSLVVTIPSQTNQLSSVSTNLAQCWGASIASNHPDIGSFIGSFPIIKVATKINFRSL